MYSIKRLMKKQPKECGTPSTQTQQRNFSRQERQAVGYFYGRLARIYGREYRSQLPDAKMERASKREHAEYICGYNQKQIDLGCDWIHKQKQNGDGWQFLDIDRCIGALKQANTVKAAHKVYRQPGLEDLTEKDRCKKLGKSESSKLKDMFT